VAATKSYIASLSAIIQLVGCWKGDGGLLQSLSAAPALMEQAWQLDWNAAVARLRFASDLYVIGRGMGLGIAQEAALKFKETCGLHAEAISSAEVRHGPMAIVRAGFPVLIFAQDDETRDGVESLATELAARRADVMIAGAKAPRVVTLPSLSADPVLEPLLIVQSFYRMVNALALARGRNPDQPPYLNKVTETV
jgi:glucosamine--fructose-6-phosphate aminotransferase (isomerizing)